MTGQPCSRAARQPVATAENTKCIFCHGGSTQGGYIKKPAELLAIKVHLQHIFEVTFQVICLTLDHPSVQSLQVFASSDL